MRIYQGGKAATNMLITSAGTVTGGISRLGEYVQSNYLQKGDEVKVNPTAMKGLKFLNSATGKLGSVSGFAMKRLTSMGKNVALKMEDKFEPKNQPELGIAQGGENREVQRRKGTVGHAAIYSAITVWGGMAEALDIIREGVTQTSSGLVVHKYGPQAGEAFRAGMGIAGNIGLPGTKLMKLK